MRINSWVKTKNHTMENTHRLVVYRERERKKKELWLSAANVYEGEMK